MTELFEEIAALKKQGRECVVVTCVEKDGSSPAAIGGKMLVTVDGYYCGTVGGGSIERVAIAKAQELLKERRCLLEKYDLGHNGGEDAKNTGMICGGYTTLFYEHISPGAHAYIFGAGHVGKAITGFLKNLNYYITVLDHRDGIFENFDGANRMVQADYENMLKDEGMPDGSYVIIATPSHVTDYAVLDKIYKSGWKPAYVGLLGSRKKVANFIQRLKEEFGENLDLDNLYSPAGLDLGGDAPHEIAISILSEMQAVRYGKNGHKHMKQE